jgi:hypothetical protein
MSVRRTLAGQPVAPTQVWSGLTTECQGRVIQLLARLASNLADLQPIPPPRSLSDGDTAPHPKNPT